MKRTLCVLMLTGLTFLGACSGERIGSGIVETATADGRWRAVDGTLIRSYTVDLKGAYDAVKKLATDQAWTIRNSESGAHDAEFTLITADNVTIDVDIWAPAGKATDIGVKYGKGDRFQSVRIFELLEPVLPGERIKVNTPQ